MLVLAATYISPFSELVARDELEKLLRRTIHFLEKSRAISPTLREDAWILRKCYAKIYETDAPPSSFSSQMSDETMIA